MRKLHPAHIVALAVAAVSIAGISLIPIHNQPVQTTAVAAYPVTASINRITQTPKPSRIGPANLYPDPQLTPGKADTFSAADIKATYTTNCPSGKTSCTYSQSHRNVSNAEKDAVYAEYEKLYPGITAYCHAPGFTSGAKQRCEVDHFCPVGGGCSNDVQNLWIQRADGTYNGQPMGFHQKDDLESWGIAEEKAGRLDPKTFDQQVWSDWVKYYLAVNPSHTTFSN